MKLLCFNTSHVTLYLRTGRSHKPRVVVSIHLMLLFIGASVTISTVQDSFNTSHVTLYHSITLRRLNLESVSIHLMLLFIRFRTGEDDGRMSFQYISCYSLSAETVLQATPRARFNTSHVTLYRMEANSCNRFIQVSIHLMLLFIELAKRIRNGCLVFQYISCYSLSP